MADDRCNSTYKGIENLDAIGHAVNYNATIIRLIAKHAGREGRLLDFGAGIGTFSALLVREGYTVECLEPDAGMGDRLKISGFNVYDSLGKVPQAKFDIIIMLNVLEHIEDDIEILKGLRTKLNPDGRIFLYVPAFLVLFSSMDKRVGHFRRYTKRTLTQCVLKAGYEIRVMRYNDSMGFFATVFFKLFGNVEGKLTIKNIKAYDTWIFPLSRLMDNLFCHFFGKNIYLVCVAPATLD